MPKIACRKCPVIIVQNKTGLCVTCWNADPDVRAQRTEQLRAILADLAARDRQRRAQCAAAAKRGADPVSRAVLSENGKRYGTPNLCRDSSPETRAKRVSAIRAAHLAWCPERYWPLNRELRNKHVPLAERKNMIADAIRREEKRDADREAERIANMTQHERNMQRLAQGGKLVAAFKPRAAERTFSLVGSSMASL